MELFGFASNGEQVKRKGTFTQKDSHFMRISIHYSQFSQSP